VHQRFSIADGVEMTDRKQPKGGSTKENKLPAANKKEIVVNRSAETGKFVTDKYAKSHTKTTETERYAGTIKRTKTASRKGGTDDPGPSLSPGGKR
jgi:hypothetical protein